MTDRYEGVLVVGDPHLEGRQPGFRKDDYPNAILEKLSWCFDYADEQNLLVACLGDLFDKPRDNANWIVARLLEMFRREVIGIYGNHDVHFQPELTEDDTLSLLVKANRYRLVGASAPWNGMIGGRQIVVGGSSYREPIPRSWPEGQERPPSDDAVGPMVIWLTHHDILIPGYDEGRVKPREIPGIDLLINGHIHRHLDDVVVGQTTWLTPGNISRRSRSDAVRDHVPAVLHVRVEHDRFTYERVEVPHAPLEQVFHEAIAEGPREEIASPFVAGLAELQARRTESGAGLRHFLDRNLGRFEPNIAREIERLAEQVLADKGENE